MFEDQTEGWWSTVSKAVICGDVERKRPSPLNALSRNVGVFISIMGNHGRILSMGETQSNLYLRMTPLAAGGA